MEASSACFSGPLALRSRLAAHDYIKLTAIVTVSIGSANFHYLCKTLSRSCWLHDLKKLDYSILSHRTSNIRKQNIFYLVNVRQLLTRQT